MRNTFIALSCLLLLLLCPSVASAQMMGPGMGHGMGPGMGPGMAYGGWGSGGGKWGGCGFSPEQKKAYAEIARKYQGEMTKISERMWAERAQLNALLAQDKIDRKQAETLAGKIGALSTQACLLRVKMLIDLRENGFSYYGLGMMGHGMMGPGMMGGGMMGGGPWRSGNRPGYGNGGAPQ